MMKVIKYLFLPCICLLFSVSTFDAAFAQSYRGAYTSAVPKQKDENPIPKVFSSQVTSVIQAEKLDILYDELLVSLRQFAATDFIYQAKLSDLISAEKFQYTRYSKEFSSDLNAGMKNLNKNYNTLLAEIQDANNRYIIIKEGIRSIDHSTLDPLWEKKIEEFRQAADHHFKLQGRFLNTYKSLIDFILKQGGSYYYKSDDNRVYFYKFGGYKFFGKSIDTLTRISYEQRKNLKENAPANIEDERSQ
ncbi:MAG: hypothetical protein ACRBCK_03080 [Alphaproteobacteria bacterium]